CMGNVNSARVVVQLTGSLIADSLTRTIRSRAWRSSAGRAGYRLHLQMKQCHCGLPGNCNPPPGWGGCDFEKSAQIRQLLKLRWQYGVLGHDLLCQLGGAAPASH